VRKDRRRNSKYDQDNVTINNPLNHDSMKQLERQRSPMREVNKDE
jgi:hypothetical protein